MSRGSIVVPRPRQARTASLLAPARAVGTSLVRTVMAYGQALNERRAAYRQSREAAAAREQEESDMLMQRITDTATSYEPVSAYNHFRHMIDQSTRATMRHAIESGYVGFVSGVNEHEYAEAPRERLPPRQEPNLAEAWAD